MTLPNATWVEKIDAIHSSADYITHEAIKQYAEGSESVDYQKRDFLFHGGTWRGQKIPRYRRSGPGIQTLVLGHSDYSISSYKTKIARRLHGVRAIFSVNLAAKMCSFESVQPLPLGLSNPTSESELHLILGRQDIVSSAWKSRVLGPPAKNKIYANFSIQTAPKFRRRLSVALSGAKNEMSIGTPDYSEKGRRRFLHEVSFHTVVVCPRGNGLDTHRFWETLYLGSIPLVLSDSYMARLGNYLNLPVLTISDWELLSNSANRRKILSQAREMLLEDWSFENLALQTWLQKFSSV